MRIIAAGQNVAEKNPTKGAARLGFFGARGRYCARSIYRPVRRSKNLFATFIIILVILLSKIKETPSCFLALNYSLRSYFNIDQNFHLILFIYYGRIKQNNEENMMIRTILTPDSEQITFPIPKKYIGSELEIIVFPVRDASSVTVYPPKVPIFGCAKGKFKISDDFDEPLEDFREYMQ
jgi:hypothetical protein